MGVNLVQWRAAIGVFNTMVMSATVRSWSDAPVDHLSWLYPLYSISLLTIGWFLAYFWPTCALVLLVVIGVILNQFSMMLLIYAIIRVTLNNFTFRSSPVCLLGVYLLPFVIVFSMPGLPTLCLGVYDTSHLIKYLLWLCGDVHPNPGPSVRESLKVWYSNVNSLSAEGGQRFTDMNVRLMAEDIGVVCLSETGCNLNLSDYNIEGYHQLDNTMYNRQGRGLLFYVKESLSYKRRYDLERGVDDCMWCQVGSSHSTVLIGLFYRSPSQSAAMRDEYMTKVDSILASSLKQKVDAVLIGGDFNARSKFWYKEDINTVEGNLLYDLSTKHALYQLIETPTRITESSKTCLDLIFCNAIGLVLNSDVTAPFSLADHCVTSISLDLKYYAKGESKVKRTWKFSQANEDTLNRAVSTFDWDSLFVGANPDDVCKRFMNSLLAIFEANVPHSDRVTKCNDMPWFNSGIKKALNKRNKLYRKMVKSNTIHNVNCYKNAARHVKEMVSSAKSLHYDRVCKSLNETSSSKNYWHILKQLLGRTVNNGIPTLTTQARIFDSDVLKSKLFLRQFSSKFKHDFVEDSVPNLQSRTEHSITNITVTSEKVRKLLQGLDSSKAGGEDGITNKMLKLVANSLDVPLCNLFNLFLSKGHFPSTWKLGIVVPIFKGKGSKCDPGNYRPVTLLNSVSKVFERSVYEVILNHLQRNNLLFERQSGFLPGHDTQKQLIDIVHNILLNNEAGKATRGVFLDISGAFDSVPHYLLIKKLQCYGIGGSILQLFSSYLNNRSIMVRVNHSLSDSSPRGYINSGVPQGSILGPLMFLIYINDLSDMVRNCRLYIYADDCSLFLPVHYNQDPVESTALLQDDLNRLSAWSKLWKLDFKAEKCKEVIFHSFRRHTIECQQVHMNDTVIPRSNAHKHLGMTLDSTLTFEQHLTHVISKCNCLLNPLKSLKGKLQSNHLEKLYCSFVLPHLEYCSVIFDSANSNLLSRLEQVHYHGALTVSGCIWGTSREKTLKCLGWMTLEQRRHEKKLVLMFDVENHNLPRYVQDNFLRYKNPVLNDRLRNQRPYILPQNVSQKFCKSAVASAITNWCSLPNDLKNSYSRNSFKYRLRLHLRGKRSYLVSTRLNLPRHIETLLNRTRCDLIFRSHFYSHNFNNTPDPACNCGFKLQTTKHLFFQCPLTRNLYTDLLDDLGGLPAFLHFFMHHCSSIEDRMRVLLDGSDQLPMNTNRKVIQRIGTFISNIVELLL